MRLLDGVSSMLRATRIQAIGLLILSCLLFPEWAPAESGKLATKLDYHRYIDPLLGVTDFQTHYYEDGAADASVLHPEASKPPYGQLSPPEPVLALVRLRERGIPLLIDCLGVDELQPCASMDTT